MLHIDKILLALLLLRIYLRCIGENTFEQEFDFLLLHSSKLHQIAGVGANQQAAKQISIPPLNEHQIQTIQSLAKLPAFKNSIEKLKAIPTKEFTEWLNSDKPELCVPQIWEGDKICNILIFFKSFLLIYKSIFNSN